MWIEMHSLMAADRGWVAADGVEEEGEGESSERGGGEYEDACLCGVSA
jgi:hypothetical protein